MHRDGEPRARQMKTPCSDTERPPHVEPSRREHNALRSLGKIGRLINRSDGVYTIVPMSALGLIAGVLGAQGLSLNQLVHNSANNFRLSCLGSWSARATVRNQPPFAFGRAWQVDDFPADWWSRLESGKTITISEPSGLGMELYSNLLFIPLLLGGHLFGFLGAEDMESDQPTPCIVDFIKALRTMIEMKLDLCDTAHRMKAFCNFMPTPTYAMNTNGEITVWNKAMEQMTGWRAERLLGKGNYEHGRPFYDQKVPTSCNVILSPRPASLSQFTAFKFKDGDLYTSAYCNALPGGGGLSGR